MALEDDGTCAVLLNLRMADVLGCTADSYVVLENYAVVNNCNGGRHAV